MSLFLSRNLRISQRLKEQRDKILQQHTLHLTIINKLYVNQEKQSQTP